MGEAEEQRERAKAAREALIGKTIAGRYILRGLVGHGGMGAVYEAEHVGLGKRVAIKFVDPEYATEEQVVARFAREARAMSAIESAHIVSVFDAGTEDGRPYLVMELLRGEDLGKRLRRTRRVPVNEALHIVAQVLKGLSRAHAAGIVHRDLKPDNVFLVQSDIDPLFAKIVDFGISKIERPRANTTPLALTGRGTVLGTPFYMSPEQAQCLEVDARADIYSVGAILFECLTGRPPHTGESYEQVILSICMRDAPDVRAIDPKVPEEVCTFVARALARERELRFGSAERMLAALHEIAPEEKIRVPLEPAAPETMVSPGAQGSFQGEKTVVGSPSFEELNGGPLSAATRLQGSGAVPEEVPVSSKARTPLAPPVSQRVSEKMPVHRAPTPSVMERSTESSFEAVPSRRPKSKGAIVATAIVATLTGVGATAAVIVLLNKRPADDLRGATPLAVSTATASVSSSNVAPSSSSEPSEPSEPVPPTTITSAVAPAVSASAAPPARSVPPVPATPVIKTPSSSAPKTTPSKPLDIQRDLP